MHDGEGAGYRSFLRRLPAAGEDTRLYCFRGEQSLTPCRAGANDTKTVAVCWTTCDSDQAVVLTSARRLPMADLYGNPGELRGDGKRVVLPLTDSPIYVFGLPRMCSSGVPSRPRARSCHRRRELHCSDRREQRTERAVDGQGAPRRTFRRAGAWRLRWRRLPSLRAGPHVVSSPCTYRLKATRGQAMLRASLDARGGNATCPVPVMVIQPIALSPCARSGRD